MVLICYHKNLYNIYEVAWINQFRESVLNQTYKEFKIYEINYGGNTERIFENSNFESKELPTFIDAMNYLIEKSLKDGATVVANSNVDDFFSLERFEKQLPYIEIGFDIVSSNFSLMKEGVIIHRHNFENVDIKKELERNHNPLAHPVIMYSKKYLMNNRYVPSECPEEDLLLWKRTIDDYKFIILPDNLLYQRIHDNSVCKSDNR